MGVFDRIFVGLAGEGAEARAYHNRRHSPEDPPDSGEPAKKGDAPLSIGLTKGVLNSKLHAVSDNRNRPMVMLLSEVQISDYKGAALMLDAPPPTKRHTG
jgi:hypothetical protein